MDGWMRSKETSFHSCTRRAAFHEDEARAASILSNVWEWILILVGFLLVISFHFTSFE